METRIVVPALGESVVEATVARWLKKEGDAVHAGEALVELETDKVNLEVGAERTGVLLRIERQSGEDVKVGEVLGVLGEMVERKMEASKTPEEAAPVPRSTPSARRMAQEYNLDLTRIQGTGAGNQITRQDVEAFLKKQEAPVVIAPETQTSARPEAEPTVEVARQEERIRMSRRRRTIAQRLVEAQHTAAMLTTYNEIDMTSVIELRKRHKESFQKRHGVSLGIVSFFVKATIGALKEFPLLNAEVQGEEIILKHYYDIGIAVGDPEGLVVPVLRDADRMGLPEIERTLRGFIQKTEDRTLSLEDLWGGTFTITNGGVFGSLLSTPILNPPQVGILGLHKIEDRPVVVNGQIAIRSMMYVALSYDHRIVDGRESVQFLVRIKQLMEDPASLLLEF